MDLSFILAHGSGIDDVLWFLIPVALAILWMRRAEKRASERAEQDQADSEEMSGGT